MPGELDQSFRLKVLGDISEYQKALAKLPDVTGKQAAAAALRMEREMVRAAFNTARAAEGAAKGGAKNLAKTFGEAKEQVALIAAGAARIDPELGAVVNTGSAAVGVLKSMASGTGLVTAAAALMGGAFIKASNDLDAAEAKANESAKLAIKAQLGLIDTSNYVNQAIELQEKISLEKRSGYWRDWARSALDAFEVVAGIIPGVSTATDFYRKKLDQLDERQQQNIKTMEDHRDRLVKLAEKEKEHTEAKKAGTKALAEREAILELVAQREAEVAAYEDEEARKKSIKDEQDRVDAIMSEVRAAAALVEAKGTLKEQGEAEAAQAKAVGIAWLDTFSTIASAAGGLFENNKAAAIATATMNIALGAAKTIAELGATPFVIPALAAEAALGAAQIAKISQQSFTPTFHSGGVFGPSSPGGGGDLPVTAQTGEAFLNRNTAARLGRKGVDALNRGGSPGGTVVSANVFGHRVMDAWQVSSLSRWNSPTRRAITKLPVGVRPGERER